MVPPGACVVSIAKNATAEYSEEANEAIRANE
jgi:hypothetical protein